MTLEDLQKKFETQAAVAELLKMLRPNGSGSGEGAVASGSLAGSSAAAAAAAALLRSHVLPQQLHQKLLQQQAQAQAQLPPPLQPAASAAAAASIPAAQGVALPAVSPPPPAAAATATPSSTEQRQLALPPQQQQVQVQLQQQQQLPPVHLEPSQCLSLEREWDWEKVSSEGMLIFVVRYDIVMGSHLGSHLSDWGHSVAQDIGGACNSVPASSSNNNNNNNSGNNGRRRSKKQQKGAGGDRGAKQRTRYERYMDVEAFWKSTSAEQRRELLRVPMASLLQGGCGVLGCPLLAGWVWCPLLSSVCRYAGGTLS